MASQPRCYARRRLHPFRGLTEVMDCTAGRALSGDGHNWRIEVRLEEESGEQEHYLWYGVWSPSEGIGRMSHAAAWEDDTLDEAAEEIVDELGVALSRLPFPLADRYERWLLDDEGFPLALLATTTREEEILDYRERRWRAVREEDVTPLLATDPARHDQQCSAGIDPTEVERLVARRAGQSPLSQWFRRAESGEGEGLPQRTPAKWAGRTLKPKRFPKFLVDHHLLDADERALLEAYVAWTAPYILALDHLSDRTRARLERAARRNALAVADTWRLYPKVIDEEAITAARVEARMRRAR